MGRRAALLLALALGAPAPRADAHPLAPALLEVRLLGADRAAVLWKTPRLRVPGARLEPVLPAGCRPTGPPEVTVDEVAVTRRWTVACGAAAVAGAAVGVRGLDGAGAAALVRIVLPGGQVVQRVATAREPRVVVPARPHRAAVVRDHVALGVTHILEGADHLLFVLGLCLLARGTRRLAGTVTAFTLGHSVTLGLVVLDVIRVPSAPVELGIAASVYVLAVEVLRAGRGPTRLARRPWIMAAAFGLLHGLGFAAALRAAGLPAGEVPAALVSFNLGVEAGQLVVVAAVVGARAALTRVRAAWPAWARHVPAYAMGAVAAFWCIERAAALLG